MCGSAVFICPSASSSSACMGASVGKLGRTSFMKLAGMFLSNISFNFFVGGVTSTVEGYREP